MAALEVSNALDTELGDNLIGTVILSSKTTKPIQKLVRGPNEPEWRKAMESELQNLEKFGVFQTVKRELGHRPLRANWVTEVKLDPVTLEGGNRQNSDPPSFSPVTSLEGIRLVLALAAKHNWHLSSFDVKNAYLNADMDEEIFMEAPFGIEIANDELLQLKKALYGARQAGRCWFKYFVRVLKKLGLKQLRSQPTILIYVDDGLCAERQTGGWDRFIRSLSKELEITVEPQLNGILGLDIHQEMDGSVVISQAAYTLELFQMESAKPQAVPATPGEMLSKKESLWSRILMFKEQLDGY